jgi:hypothetical protein
MRLVPFASFSLHGVSEQPRQVLTGLVLLDKLIVILQPICLPAIEVLPSSQKLTNLDL